MYKEIDPNKSISNEFDHFVKYHYKDKPFPQFEATGKFFQWYFQTDLKLNDFKNMIGYVKRQARDTKKYKFVKKEKNRNFYKKVK
jgi:hypothetical protein